MFGDHSLLWGEVPVDGAWLSLWDLSPNTKGARKMMTTMPMAVHASEDGSKLSIWAWCLRQFAVGYASLWRMGTYLSFFLACLRERQMLTTYRSKYISVSEIRPAVPKPQFQFIKKLRLKAPLIYIRFLEIAWYCWMMRCISTYGISTLT